MRIVVVIAAFLAIVSTSKRAAAHDADAQAKRLARFLNDQTIAVLHADFRRVDAEAILGKLKEIDPSSILPPTQHAADTRRWLAEFTKAGGRELYAVFSISGPGRGGVSGVLEVGVIVPLQRDADSRTIGRLLSSKGSTRLLSHSADTAPPSLALETTAQLENFIIGGTQPAVERLTTLEPTPRPELAQAFAAAGDTAAQLVIMPSADHRRVVEELLPVLPAEIGGGPSTAVTRGLLWAVVAFEPPPKMRLRGVVQSQDAAAAEALRGVLAPTYKFLGGQPRVRKLLPSLEKTLGLLTPSVAGDRLTLALDEKQTALVLAKAALPGLHVSGEPGRRVECQNRLRQFSLALHTYHDQHKRFPPRASFDKKGQPLLSWRVHILPFLASGGLYEEFHLDEPWDSEHNRKLIPRMPAVFRCPYQKTEEGKTCYVAPVGEKTIFPPDGKPVTFGDIRDGTVNTILLVEVDDAHAVTWTKPEDLNYDPKNPLAGLVGHHEGGFHACFADDSVRFLPETIDLETLRASFTRNGGEPIF